MELLNSKVNHKDYMFDHVAWGVEVMPAGQLAAGENPVRHSTTHRSWMAHIVRNIRDHYQ